MGCVSARSPSAAYRPKKRRERLELHANGRARLPIVVEGPGRRIVTTGVGLEAKARVNEALEEERAGRVGLVRHWLGLGGAAL